MEYVFANQDLKKIGKDNANKQHVTLQKKY